MSLDPFELLLDMEQKCKKYARPLPLQKAMGKTWQGVGILIEETHFVVPLSEIIEILPVPFITPVPAGVEWFRGIANFRGQLTPITDLQAFLTGVAHEWNKLSRIIVIEFEQSNVGFLVNQVLGVQRFLEKNLLPLNQSETNTKFSPYLQGEFKHDTKRWYVLSLKMLSQSPQFYHVIREAGVKTV